MIRCIKAIVLGLVLVSFCGMNGEVRALQDNDPFAESASNDAPKWANRGDQGERDGVRVIMPIPDRDAKITFAPAPSSFVAVGEYVIDAIDGKQVGTVKANFKPAYEDRALSPNGQYFAYETDEDNVMFVQVVDCKTGQNLHALKYTTDTFRRIEFLQFTKHNHLVAVVGAKSGSEIIVWRMSDGKELRRLETERLDGSKVGITADGRYIAAAFSGKVDVFDVSKGNQVARMEKPSTEKPLDLFIFVRCLAFSPDSSELATLINVDGFRLVIWDSSGKIVEDQKLGLQIGGAYNDGRNIEWAPDGRALLLHGNFVFDRGFRAIAWVMKPPVQHRYHHTWFGSEYIIATRGDFQNRDLVAVRVPRKEIQSAVDSLESGTPALLKPGDGVTVEIKVGESRFVGASEVEASLRKTLSDRLVAGGLKVGPGQATTLTVTYSESKGEQLRVVEGPSLLRGRDTGQRVSETVVVLNASMSRKGTAKPIWQTEVKKGNPRILRSDQVNNAEVRKATFRGLEYLLSSMSIPSFVPADPAAPGLPIIKGL